MKKIKIISFVFILTTGLTTQVFASWWNPLTWHWFKKTSPIVTQQAVTNNVSLVQNSQATLTTSKNSQINSVITESTESQDVKWKTYASPQYGFQIDYVDGTKLPEHMYGPNDNAIRFQPINSKENSQGSFVINIMSGENLDCSRVKAGGKSFTKTSINGINFTEQDVIQDLPNSSIRFTEYCTIKNNVEYLISLVPPKDTSVTNDPTLNRVISSFKFIK